MADDARPATSRGDEAGKTKLESARRSVSAFFTKLKGRLRPATK